MLALLSIVGLVFSVVLVVTAVYEKLPSWVVVGLFGNVAYSVSFVLRVM